MTGFQRIPQHWSCRKCGQPMEFTELYFLAGRLVGVQVKCWDCDRQEELWKGKRRAYDMREVEMV